MEVGSTRTRLLLADAIRVAAKVLLKAELSAAETHELAMVGNLKGAVKLLARRLKLQRSVPGGSDRQTQIRLAVMEVAAETTGIFDRSPGVRARFIREAVEAESGRFIEEAILRRKVREAEELLLKQQVSSTAERKFIRRANRLLMQQLNELRSIVGDMTQLMDAIDGLTAIYSRFLSRAFSGC